MSFLFTTVLDFCRAAALRVLFMTAVFFLAPFFLAAFFPVEAFDVFAAFAAVLLRAFFAIADPDAS
jgi:hypothetical protein